MRPPSPSPSVAFLRPSLSPGLDAGIAAGLSACLLLWVCVSDPVRILVAWAVAPLFPVRSVPAMAALITVTGTAWTLHLAGRHRPVPSRNGTHRGRVLTAALAVGLLAGHVAAALAHFLVLAELDPKAGWTGLHWLDDKTLDSAPWHIQAGRTALSLAGDLNRWLAAGVDQAAPMAAHLPPWFGASVAAALLLAAAAALCLLPVVARRFPSCRPVTWLYACGALNAVAAIADGGPLSVRGLCGLATLGVVLRARDGPHLLRLAVRVGPWLTGAILVLTLATPVDGTGVGNPPLVDLAGYVTVAILPLLAYWQPRRAARKRIRVALLAVYVACAGLLYSSSALNGVGSLLQPLSAGGRYAVIDADGLSLEASGPMAGGATPADVYREFGDDPLAPRRVFVWRDTAEPHGPIVVDAAFVGAAPSPDREPATTLLRLVEVVPARDATRQRLSFRPDDTTLPPFRADDRSMLSRHNDRVHLELAAAWLRASGRREGLLRLVPDAAAGAGSQAIVPGPRIHLVRRSD